MWQYFFQKVKDPEVLNQLVVFMVQELYVQSETPGATAEKGKDTADQKNEAAKRFLFIAMLLNKKGTAAFMKEVFTEYCDLTS